VLGFKCTGSVANVFVPHIDASSCTAGTLRRAARSVARMYDTRLAEVGLTALAGVVDAARAISARPSENS
jgi:hypothetical protein